MDLCPRLVVQYMIDNATMIISQCIPCHGRTYDLKKTLPYSIEAANASPPVEIVILDYNSPDDLGQYIEATNRMAFANGVSLHYRKYTGRDYYHMAHARNLSVLASHGDYIAISSTDISVAADYFKVIRETIERENPVWMHDGHYGSVMVCRRDEFIASGGYDERFEYYGQEDKDMELRLMRRGAKLALLPRGMLTIIKTPDADKVKNYRIKSRRKMFELMRKVYEENIASGALVANPGGWGSWT